MNKLAKRKSVFLMRQYGIVKDRQPLHRFLGPLKVALPPTPRELPWSLRQFKESGIDVFLKYENANLQMAVHSLVNEKGMYDRCKLIDADEKVENISCIHGRDQINKLTNENLGQHIHEFPELTYEREKLAKFAMTEYPSNKWRSCHYFPPDMPGGPPINAEKVPVDMLGDDKNNRYYMGRRVFTVPEPQGDGMNGLAHAYLESLAMDVSQDMEDRRWAMTYLFELVDFDWVKDLPRHPCAPHIVSLLRKALLLDMDAEGHFPWTSSDSYELLNCVDFWQREADGRDGMTNLEVEMEAVKPPPLPLPRKAAA